MDKAWGCLIIWEFRIRAGAVRDFEREYGAEGDWVGLFSEATDFVGTELVRDSKDPLRYVTLDYWKSHDAYDRFRRENTDRYEEIDTKCQGLTESEVEIGRFERTVS